MIEPIRIKLRHDEATRSEIIEIDSGGFLGHHAGTLSVAKDARGESIDNTYAVNNLHYTGLEAALNACMAAAYSYVATEIGAEV